MEVKEKLNQVTVARFPVIDKRGPGLVLIDNLSRQVKLTLSNLRNAYSLAETIRLLKVCSFFS